MLLFILSFVMFFFFSYAMHWHNDSSDYCLEGSVATFSWNSFSACCQTRTFCQSFRPSRLGSKSALKASDASRGSKLGKWSMLMTLSGRSLLPSGSETGTVGSLKVVLMS